MAGNFNARQVVESTFFSACRDKLEADIKRWDEITRGVQWALATRPETSSRIPGTDIHVLKTDALQGVRVNLV